MAHFPGGIQDAFPTIRSPKGFSASYLWILRNKRPDSTVGEFLSWVISKKKMDGMTLSNQFPDNLVIMPEKTFMR
jgi:hypothetical protein